MTVSDLPILNASLNAISAVLLVTGRSYIKKKNRIAHKRCMIAAFCVSSAFLVSYIVYHSFHGVTFFHGPDWARYLYYTILGSHTILAIIIVPLVIITLIRGLRERFDKHRRIARWTQPIWLYVSVTGVVVYVMLYQIFV